jgi:hypothetical protein
MQVSEQTFSSMWRRDLNLSVKGEEPHFTREGDGLETQQVYRGADVGILKAHQVGLCASKLCRKHRISDGTFYSIAFFVGASARIAWPRLQKPDEQRRRGPAMQG